MTHFVYRNSAGTMSFRFARTPLRALAFLAVLLIVIMLVALTMGDFDISVADVFRALLSIGETSDRVRFFVNDIRLPRILTAVMVGAALGLAGATFQRVVRNPLASPDILGITTGASMFAALAIFNGFSHWSVNLAGVTGAMVIAITVYLLAYKNGASPMRLILVGVGMTAALGGGISFIVTRTEIEVADRILRWTTGSLSLTGWDETLLAFAAVAIWTPILLLLERRLSVLELGDDLTSTLGINRETSIVLLLSAASVLTGLVIAASGPIGFVALIAPHAARGFIGRLNGSGMLVALMFGALLMLMSDIVAQFGLNVSVPTGAITAAVGAPYFLFVLYRGAKNGTF